MSKSCAIIAGGASINKVGVNNLNQLNMAKIVCNKAILDVPSADYFITIDYTFTKKLGERKKDFDNWKRAKFFVANLHPEYMKKINGIYTDTRTNLKYDLSDFNVVVESHNKEEFGDTFTEFGNGYNSGFCAIQLALLLGYTQLYLFGFDFVATDSTHYHGGYGESVQSFQRKLDTYYSTLKDAILQYKKYHPNVIFWSCSEISKLNEIIPIARKS